MGGSDMTKEQQQKAAYLAQEVLRLSRDSIIMNMRFLDAALSAMRPVSQPGLKGVADRKSVV